jgi:hypothetical protein
LAHWVVQVEHCVFANSEQFADTNWLALHELSHAVHSTFARAEQLADIQSPAGQDALHAAQAASRKEPQSRVR